jgi:ATP-dependent DNA helicase RecQ
MAVMPPSPNVDAALRERFGFPGFRPGQRELIEAALAGRDALGILPTGGGKSLTYQLPATLLDGLTVIVSPLIALMNDQVDAFNRRGLGRAVAIHSHLSPRDARAALDQARSGAARLLYLAPERLEVPEWRARLGEATPRLLVIDEAHCVSQWGYDFRPAYLALREIVARVRPCAVLALTATATPAVREDVVRQLGLLDPLVFVAPFDRPNLTLDVVPCEAHDKMARLTEILGTAAGGGSQIVYVGRRRDAEEIAEELDGMGLRAVAYHAGLPPEQRQRAQETWLSGRQPIVVATIAFGMGIDKPDVRTVVHWQHPASLEAYYQEAGRAGRDGRPARCVILFSARDVGLHHYFLDHRYPTRDDVKRLLREIPEGRLASDGLGSLGEELTDEQRNVAVLALIDEGLLVRDPDGGLRRLTNVGPRRRLSLRGMQARRDADYARLEAIVAYCRDRRCQRRHLLAYFGETLPEDFRCGNCSACRRRTRPPAQNPRVEVMRGRGERQLVGRPVPRSVGMAILKLVADADGLLAPSGVANVLRGSRACDAVRAHPHLAESGLFGTVKDRSYEDLVADTLAMHAKGFLTPAADAQRLGLAESGQRALAAKGATDQTPAASAGPGSGSATRRTH